MRPARGAPLSASFKPRPPGTAFKFLLSVSPIRWCSLAPGVPHPEQDLPCTFASRLFLGLFCILECTPPPPPACYASLLNVDSFMTLLNASSSE